MPNNRNLIYEGVQTINCNLSNHIIIGEDTYLLNCSISDYVQINRRNIMENVVVGECTYTGANTVVKHSVIGKYCSLSWNISATGNFHDYERITTHPFVHLKSFAFVDNDDKSNFKPISIGNDVWIGANVCVLPGVNIGDGAVIGAGSVVTKSIPPYAIVVGNPARIIKYRFPEDIVVLLEKAKWWNWPREIIMKNMSLFNSKMTKEIAEQLYELSKEIRCYE